MGRAARARVRLWAKRRWWVDPFLVLMFWPTALVAQFSEHAAMSVCDWIGWVIGRYGMKMGAD